MTWVSNGIDFNAWLLFFLMINDFMKYSNSMDFHFARGQGNGDVNIPASNPEVQTHIRHHCIVTKLREVNKSLSDQ
jgi:hypothetical protein